MPLGTSTDICAFFPVRCEKCLAVRTCTEHITHLAIGVSEGRGSSGAIRNYTKGQNISQGANLITGKRKSNGLILVRFKCRAALVILTINATVRATDNLFIINIIRVSVRQNVLSQLNHAPSLFFYTNNDR